MTRRATTFGVTLLFFVLSFSGVAGAQEPPTQITLWLNPSGIDLTRRIGVEIRAFEEANPTIDVEVEFVAWSDALTYVQEAAAGLRAAPDVLQVGSTWMSSLASDGVLAALTPEEQAIMGTPDDFITGLWEAGTYDDAFYGVPWIIDTRAIIYRADILEQVGIDPATAFTDWASFDETLRTLRDANLFVEQPNASPLQVYPIAVAGRPETNAAHDLAPWIWGAGGNFLTDDNMQAALDDPAAIAGYEYYTGLYLKGYMPRDIQNFTLRDADSMFIGRRTAMTISGAWIIQRIRTTGLADEIAVSLLPAGESGRYAFLGGSALSVWDASDEREAALTLIEYLTGPESQSSFTRNAGLLPAREAVLTNAGFLNDPDYSVFASAIEFGRTYPRVENWAAVEVTLSRAVEDLWQQVVFNEAELEQRERLVEIVNAQAAAVNEALTGE